MKSLTQSQEARLETPAASVHETGSTGEALDAAQAADTAEYQARQDLINARFRRTYDAVATCGAIGGFLAAALAFGIYFFQRPQLSSIFIGGFLGYAAFGIVFFITVRVMEFVERCFARHAKRIGCTIERPS